MKKSKTRNKFLAAAVSTVVVASVVAPVLPYNVPQANATGTSFTDVKKGTYYYDAVTNLAERGVINGFKDGMFRPSLEVTRAQAAYMIATSLQLNGKSAKNPGFTDIKKGQWFYDSVAGLVEAGVISGKTKESFKPNDSITRSELAKFIALAYGLKGNKESVGYFTDVNPNAWYGSYVGALIDNQITNGYTSTTFGTSKTVTRGQIATFIYKAEKAIKSTKPLVIEEITEDSVSISGVTYQVAPSLKSIFNQSNEEILKHALIKFTEKDGVISEITYVDFTQNGTNTNHLVFDGKDAVIAGDVKVNGDYLSIKNLKIKGNLVIGKNVKNQFYSDRLVVDGETTISNEKAVSTAALNSDTFYKSLSRTVSNFQVTAATSFTTRISFNQSNLGSVHLNRNDVNLEVMGSSVLQDVLVAANAGISVSSGVVRSGVTIRPGGHNVELNGDFPRLTIEARNPVVVTGKADIINAIIKQSENVVLELIGEINKLKIAHEQAILAIVESLRIQALELTEGMRPEAVIKDYEQIKNKIESIGGRPNPDYIPAPTFPGGSTPTLPSDQTAPILSDITLGERLENSVNVILTSNEIGKAYYVVLPAEEDAPSSAQVKAGKNRGGQTVELKGSKTVRGGIETNFNINDLSANTSYTIYIVAEDRAGNLSSVSSLNVRTEAAVTELNMIVSDITDAKDGKNFTIPITTQGVVGSDYRHSNVRFYATFEGLTAENIEIEELEEIGSYEIINTGGDGVPLTIAWGSEDGFLLSDYEEQLKSKDGWITPLKVIINKEGDYTVNYSLKTVGDNSTEVATGSNMIHVSTELNFRPYTYYVPTFIFSNKTDWEENIKEVLVDGVVIEEELSYLIFNKDDESAPPMEADEAGIAFNPILFPEEKQYTITVKSDGFADVNLTVQGPWEMPVVPPAQMVDLTVTDTTHDSVTLSWENSENYDDIRIYVNDNEIATAEIGNATSYTLLSSSSVLDENPVPLTPETEYSIRIEFRHGGSDYPEAVGMVTATTDKVSEQITSKAITNFDFSTTFATNAKLTSVPITVGDFTGNPKRFTIISGDDRIPVEVWWKLSTDFTKGQAMGSVVESAIQQYFLDKQGVEGLMNRTLYAVGLGDTFSISAFKTGADSSIRVEGTDWTYFFKQNTSTGTDYDTSKNRTFTVSDGNKTATIRFTDTFTDIDAMLHTINTQLTNANVLVTAEKIDDSHFSLIPNSPTVNLVVGGDHVDEFF